MGGALCEGSACLCLRGQASPSSQHLCAEVQQGEGGGESVGGGEAFCLPIKKDLDIPRLIPRSWVLGERNAEGGVLLTRALWLSPAETASIPSTPRRLLCASSNAWSRMGSQTQCAQSLVPAPAHPIPASLSQTKLGSPQGCRGPEVHVMQAASRALFPNSSW